MGLGWVMLGAFLDCGVNFSYRLPLGPKGSSFTSVLTAKQAVSLAMVTLSESM